MPLYMKLISDIHEEFKDSDSPDGYFHLDIPKRRTDKDTVLVVAGDLNSSHYSSGPRKIVDTLEKWGEQFKYVVYVMGNHDYWGGELDRTPEKINELIHRRELENVYNLDEDSVILDGVNFIGCTLWSDFAPDPLTEMKLNQSWADLKMIRLKAGAYRRVRAQDIAMTHLNQAKFIDDMLSFFRSANDNPNVVVTHHLPHINSIAPRFKNSPVNCCYYSDQSEILEKHDIAYWCHGHTHDSCDYMIHDTRVLCNPHGYYLCEENPEFEPDILFTLKD